MSIYYVIVIWISLSVIFYTNKNLKPYIYWSTVIILGLIMGLRDVNVGIDTHTYQGLFSSISKESWGKLTSGLSFGHLEIGYVLINKGIYAIGGNYYTLQFLLSSITCFNFGFCFWKLSKEPLTSLIIYMEVLYLSGLNVSRQCLAISFLFLVWYFWINKKYIFTLIFFIIACSFHITSILFLLVFLIYFLSKQKWAIPATIIGSVFILTSYLTLVQFVAEYFIKYGSYFNNDRSTITAGLSQLVWMIEAICSFYILLNKKRFNHSDKTIAILSICAILLFLIGLQFNLFDRIAWIFLPFVCLLFPIVGKSLKKNIQIPYFFFVNFFFLIWFILTSQTKQYTYLINIF